MNRIWKEFVGQGSMNRISTIELNDLSLFLYIYIFKKDYNETHSLRYSLEKFYKNNNRSVLFLATSIIDPATTTEKLDYEDWRSPAATFQEFQAR